MNKQTFKHLYRIYRQLKGQDITREVILDQLYDLSFIYGATIHKVTLPLYKPKLISRLSLYKYRKIKSINRDYQYHYFLP